MIAKGARMARSEGNPDRAKKVCDEIARLAHFVRPQLLKPAQFHAAARSATGIYGGARFSSCSSRSTKNQRLIDNRIRATNPGTGTACIRLKVSHFGTGATPTAS